MALMPLRRGTALRVRASPREPIWPITSWCAMLLLEALDDGGRRAGGAHGRCLFWAALLDLCCLVEPPCRAPR